MTWARRRARSRNSPAPGREDYSACAGYSGAVPASARGRHQVVFGRTLTASPAGRFVTPADLPSEGAGRAAANSTARRMTASDPSVLERLDAECRLHGDRDAP